MATYLEVAGTSEVAAERCLNCNEVLAGKYCHACGQKRLQRHEFAIKHFFGHLVHEFTHLDSNKILRTLFALLFRPGLLTSEYLAGRKSSYINPIRIYLTFSALYFLFAYSTLSAVRGGAARTARSSATIALARQRGVEPRVLADKIFQKAEKIVVSLRFGSVLISGLFLSALYLGMRKYYVEHLIFSLHYYSFDFLCKSFFALMFLVAAAVGVKLPESVLNFFYPVGLIYLVFALRRVYQQSWAKSGLKALLLFICETLLFMALNVAGFFAAFGLV